ncbi:hypothetical protein U1Q18_045466 [Sarracenia purpurea var. burkii]
MYFLLIQALRLKAAQLSEAFVTTSRPNSEDSGDPALTLSFYWVETLHMYQLIPHTRYRDDYFRDRGRDYYRRSHSRSWDRYERDMCHGRQRDYRYRSRSRSASLDYGLSRGRYNDERQQSRSRSFKSALPLQRSPSPQRSLSPRRTPSESSDRRNRSERSATPLRGRQAYR